MANGSNRLEAGKWPEQVGLLPGSQPRPSLEHLRSGIARSTGSAPGADVGALERTGADGL